RNRVDVYDRAPANRLEQILQSKLHDSRIPRRSDFPEQVAVQIEGRIHHDETVQNVERFRAEFHLLHFTHLERPGEGKVELPEAGTLKSAHAGIGKRRSECRLRKRKRIEEIPGRAIAVRISQNLVGALSDQYSIADAKP